LKNLYQTLLRELENNENKLVMTKLNGANGSLQEDFKREIIDMTNEETDMGIGKPKVIMKKEEITILEPFYPKERLIILGGGHIALPLVEFGARVGFAVTVVDDRPSFANRVRFPLANKVICESFEKVFSILKITSYDYIVIITRGHRHDTDCLRQILKQTESIYVGMIGSKRRVGAVKDTLIEEGYAKERIQRVCTPIGLLIGAVTPEEISISIIAEIIKRKRLDIKEGDIVNRSDLDYEVINLLAKCMEPSSIVTVISTKGSVPRGAGAKMLVYPTGQIAGSIGGGCSEAAVIHNAINIIGSKSYMIQRIDMTEDIAESEGMVCGGIMDVLIEDNLLFFD
jgi:xanthine dehydrogenase accessory factor